MSELRCHGCGTPLSIPRRGKAPKWCSEACRKRTCYSGSCETCGTRTSYSGSGTAASRECNACAAERRRVWDRDRILAAMREWKRLTGREVTAADWGAGDADMVEKRRVMRPSGEWPSVVVVQRRFGSWNAAIEAAGYEPCVGGHKRSERVAA